MNKICLIGFMGCGKSTIGASLAQKMGVPMVDLDAYLVDQLGMPIADFFAKEGEAAFRKWESYYLEEVLSGEYKVIATGGGIITNSDNIEKLKKAQTVFLDYPFNSLYERIKGDRTRPLVTTYEALHQRYFERLPLYKEAAGMRIACEGKSINAITQEIITKLESTK